MPNLLPSRKQWAKWSLPSKYSLYGLILGVIGAIPVTLGFIQWLSPQNTPPIEQVQPAKNVTSGWTPKAYELMDKAYSELRDNLDCINSYREQLEQESYWPLCKTHHKNFDTLFQERFFVIGKTMYGEDNTLLGQWQEMSRTGDALNWATSAARLRAIEAKSSLSLYDFYFETAFIAWYIDQRRLQPSRRTDRATVTPQDYSGIPNAKWAKWPAREVVNYDGQRVSDFGEWLGLLD